MTAFFTNDSGYSYRCISSLKTIKGIVNVAKKAKDIDPRITHVEIWNTSDANPRPFYNPGAKPDKIVEL